MKADFSGYATKSGIRCSDGRTIMSDAFKKQDGTQVPLVWQHGHSDVENVLGHAILENRQDGVYAYGFFNETDKADHARMAVKHGDVNAMSIYANRLVQNQGNVQHGEIREVSLVVSGANPGALIDNVYIRHSDETVESIEDEAIIYTGLSLSHADEGENTNSEESNMADKDRTIQDVFDAFNEEQKNVVYFMIGQALEDAGTAPADDDDALEQADLSDFLTHEEGFNMINNVFEMAKSDGRISGEATLSHSQVQTIVKDASKHGSLKDSFLAHAGEYGIEDIELLFPDAKAITNTPEFLSRRMEWVSAVLTGTKHSPFTRIKSVHADITADEARAKGYVKGTMKKEEIFKLLQRKTTPTTIYKKQKLDRDDVLDITDLDVVAWLKGEMRLMLDEEIARAVLLGDNRSFGDDDKIDETHIRPIAKDDHMYAHQVTLPDGASVSDNIEFLIRSRAAYKGSGLPTLFTTQGFMTDMLLVKDKIGRPLFDNQDQLASKLMVSKIVPVEVMEEYEDVVAIYVNLADYTIGTDAGGQLSMFDDFDIDFNQMKYLMETRMSGALTKAKSAIVVNRVPGIAATPVSPSFNGETNTISIPTTAGVVYSIEGIEVSGQEVISSDTEVEAKAAEGHYIPSGTVTNWTFVYSGE